MISEGRGIKKSYGQPDEKSPLRSSGRTGTTGKKKLVLAVLEAICTPTKPVGSVNTLTIFPGEGPCSNQEKKDESKTYAGRGGEKATRFVPPSMGGNQEDNPLSQQGHSLLYYPISPAEGCRYYLSAERVNKDNVKGNIRRRVPRHYQWR